MKTVLELNVDDQGYGGVFSLVLSVIRNCPDGVRLDIGALEPFEKQAHIDELKRMGSEVHYLGYDGNKLLKQLMIFRNVRKLLREEKYDCVHLHSDVANKLLVSGLAARSCGVRIIVLHSHATGVDLENGRLREYVHRICRRFLPLIRGKYAACSEEAGRWMFPWIREKGQITCIRNGIDTERFRFRNDTRIHVRQELNIAPEDRLIGHVGRFMYQKNHAFLLDAFKAAKEKWNRQNRTGRLRLLLTGTGDLMEPMNEKAERLGIADDVIFYGQSDQVDELFQAMDLFVLPSHFEGFGIAALEAQCTGLPCLLSDQVPPEVSLSRNVEFLPIGAGDEEKWAAAMTKNGMGERRDQSELIRKAGYDIHDTVRQLLDMYEV